MLKKLSKQFGTLEGVRFETLAEGFPAVCLDTDISSAVISLYGAHVIEWRYIDDGEPVIAPSSAVQCIPGKAIRGGIPICWPWFGASSDPALPQHGFARISMWTLSDIWRIGEEMHALFTLIDTPDTRALWPHAFRLEYTVTVGRELRTTLKVTNTGNTPFAFSCALHNYFRVKEIEHTTIHGLECCEYFDLNDNLKHKVQSGTLKIAGPVDRDYPDTDEVIIDDVLLKRRIIVNKENCRAITVWNPWIDDARKMADYGDEDYRHLVCVEPAILPFQPVEQRAGTAFEMRQIIRVEKTAENS